MEAKLVVVGGEAKTGEIKLKLPAVVGRSHDADVRLSHPLVSRKHCEFSEVDGMLFVRDLGSLNGTFVADSRVTESIIKPNDLITIGPAIFRAVYNGRVAEAATEETEEVAGKKTVRVRDTVQPATAVAVDATDEFDFDADLSSSGNLADIASTVQDVSRPAEDAETDLEDFEFELDEPESQVQDVVTKPSAPNAAQPAARPAEDDDELAPVDDFDLDELEGEDGDELSAKDSKDDLEASAADEFDFDDLDDDDDDKKKKSKKTDGDDEELDDFLKGLGIE